MMTEECILNYDLFRISTLIIMTHLLIVGTFKNWVNDCLIDMSDFLENKFVHLIENNLYYVSSDWDPFSSMEN